ncbi:MULTISPECIES: hypothetical protein [Mycobacterium]|uniref:Uncharacterized protein n=4 Tax=Mycobacterium TaxID=1763 RepID=A0A557Y179_9MYCO|nr:MULTISPECIES: hypothetical protein [Mycobacterium]ARV80832.1 hypothetical protein BWK49_05740 [Mycobacterium intracellulare subsp. chimaera]ASL07820.1 hypothetical protein MYCODSM44623_01061 [Mycobacterium intracellulare subsp. chimaera]ASL13473.1 hypothetical protein MYCOZU2_01031 [Mycobacterium intracellulare subsp. chimaera]ASL19607.1 hypothetical protein MYCOZU1_01156 [Mycobacterium intracellulare subsp. chimaera]ELR83590.1 hypothetical protein W7U_00080 [Mycobacterium sp. H4Y]
MPAPDIFNFDDSNLATYDPKKINRVLSEQPALYINHLRIARSIAGWADRLDADATTSGAEFQRGYAKALREIAAHLRQADYVEGGPMIVEH